MAQRIGTVIVVGASMAGLLTAAALHEHADEVVLLDRDRLPAQPEARAGVPQTRQVHGLLAGGQRAIEELLPGITDRLVADGAELGDFQERVSWYVGERPLARGTSGLHALAVSRPLLEFRVRERVAALPRVTVRPRTTVLDLMVEGRRVTGVRAADLDTDRHEVIDGDLVVDASGRTSRMPEWLERNGFHAPKEERVRIDVSYATRLFRRRPEHADGEVAVLQPSSPELPRSAIMLAQEGDRWVVGLTGYHGTRPPTALPDFVAYAATMPGPVGRILADLEPLGEGATYRFAANVRRRYEELPRFPAGLLVTGDALCAFDPAYGQGMSVAALEAAGLRDVLRSGATDLVTAFFSLAGTIVDAPWMMVVGLDRELPGATEPVPLATRLVNRYLRALLQAATVDAGLARTFLRVSNLVAPPSTLMTPRVMARVLRVNAQGAPAARVGRTAAPATRGPSAPLAD